MASWAVEHSGAVETAKVFAETGAAETAEEVVVEIDHLVEVGLETDHLVETVAQVHLHKQVSGAETAAVAGVSDETAVGAADASQDKLSVGAALDPGQVSGKMIGMYLGKLHVGHSVADRRCNALWRVKLLLLRWRPSRHLTRRALWHRWALRLHKVFFFTKVIT